MAADKADVFVPREGDAVDAAIDRYALRKGVAFLSSDAEGVAEAVSTVLAASVTPQRVLDRAAQIGRDAAQLERLLQARGIAQRTPEWYAARGELITASDAAQALNCAKFGNQKMFFAKKCGYEKEAFNPNVPPLKWGTMYEAVAAEAYERRFGATLNEFGLLRHPDHDFLGASPDGINELGVMVEIKCPYRRKINGEVPMQYYYQIQGQLHVCGLHACDYMECEISEYEDWDALEQGADPAFEFKRAASGEHGFVLEVSPKITLFAEGDPKPSEFFYSKQGLAPDELRREWDSILAGLPEKSANFRAGGDVRMHLYRVARMSVQRIVRDEGFASDMIEQLRGVWDRVLEYRTDRAKYDAEVKGSAENKRAPRSTAAAVLRGAENAVTLGGGYAFIDDNEEK